MYIIQKATHVGRDHILFRINCQDALITYKGSWNGQQAAAGVICDGCSKGDHSEVGAKLGAAFIIREIVRYGQRGVPLQLIPELIYPSLLTFLRGIMSSYTFLNPTDEAVFINNHLLFTVVGFAITETEAIAFAAGDGMIIINDEVTFIDEKNKPKYPGYHLVDRSLVDSPGPLPDGFRLFEIDRQSLRRLAVGSDAWEKKEERPLVDEIWGFDHPDGLQRRVNQWSKTDHRFKDDVSVIVVKFPSASDKEDDDGSGDQ